MSIKPEPVSPLTNSLFYYRKDTLEIFFWDRLDNTKNKNLIYITP